MRNFDLNIYDRLAYETSGEETGEWAVVAYELPEAGYDYMHEESLLLSDSNVQYMRIDGEESDDFLIDSDTLIDEGRMPRRVARWLEGLDAKA